MHAFKSGKKFNAQKRIKILGLQAKLSKMLEPKLNPKISYDDFSNLENTQKGLNNK